MKILSVEDDAMTRLVQEAALHELGHELSTAGDGEEAWSVFQRNPVRVIVSDWAMPRVDGLELCRRVRALGGDYVYFILLTQRSVTLANREAALAAGVDDFLTKPANIEELWMRLKVAERILGFTQQLKQLESFLPICCYCKKIRDDRNYWNQIEEFINARTGTHFSHSICPDCYKRKVIPQLKKTGRQ
jgi:DNA-binding response OmpR family regulator